MQSSADVESADSGRTLPSSSTEKESQSSPTTIAAPTVPDGGWVAWGTVLGAVLIQFAAGFANAFGVFQDFFVREFMSNYSSSQISWIGSLATFLLMGGGVVSGRLFDRGYFYALMASSSLLIIVSLFTLSLAQPQQYYQVFLTLGLGFGIGTGLMYVPSIAIVAHHFSTKRALVMGIVASGSSLGALLYPIMLNNLLHGSVGYANGVRASAGLITGCLVLAALLMRTRLPPRKQKLTVIAAARKFIKDDVYVMAVLGTFMVVQGVFFPLFYIQLYSDQHGLNPVFGFYSLTILSFASFVGRVAGGTVVNRFGVFNAIIFCSFACGVLILSMVGVVDIAGVVMFSLIYGFFSGAYITLVGPMLASLATDVSEIGERIGVAYVFTGIGSLIGTPITGALLTRDFIWWRPIVYIGVMTFAGMALFIACRMIVGRRTGTARC